MRTTHTDENKSARGAYVLAEGDDATIIATGSEVNLAMAAREKLAADGIKARVVSAPSFELFAQQPEAYRLDVLGDRPRVGVEAGIRQGWDQCLRLKDGFVGMTGFGASAPAGDLFEDFGITPAAVASEVKRLIGEEK